MDIFEGGNVFKDNDGRALTQRINQTDVKSTLAWLEQMLPGLDLQNNTLGSTGIKDTSGDLDIAVDSAQLTKEQLVAQLTSWAQSQGFKPADWVKKTGAGIHFKTPINGNPDMGYVQTDFMFLQNVPWSKFVLGAMPADSKYKGRERNVLMNSIAKSLGYKLNQIAGIADRATNEIITNHHRRSRSSGQDAVEQDSHTPRPGQCGINFAGPEYRFQSGNKTSRLPSTHGTRRLAILGKC